MSAKAEQRVVAQATERLVGRTVVRVRYMLPTETKQMDWPHRSMVLEFDDGTIAYTACDEAENDAGVLFVQAKRTELCLGRFPA